MELPETEISPAAVCLCYRFDTVTESVKLAS